jgi:hypothetical protein
MPTPKKPQDHKPKAVPDESERFRFDWKGESYELPPPDEAMPRISGRLLRDAFLDAEEGQMRLGFSMLENCDADPAALDALYDMPANDMLELVTEWMQTRRDELAANVGESSRSVS